MQIVPTAQKKILKQVQDDVYNLVIQHSRRHPGQRLEFLAARCLESLMQGPGISQ